MAIRVCKKQFVSCSIMSSKGAAVSDNSEEHLKNLHQQASEPAREFYKRLVQKKSNFKVQDDDTIMSKFKQGLRPELDKLIKEFGLEAKNGSSIESLLLAIEAYENGLVKSRFADKKRQHTVKSCRSLRFLPVCLLAILVGFFLFGCAIYLFRGEGGATVNGKT